MLHLRPYKDCDAAHIAAWLKDEFSFRQWSADRYESYPVTASDINAYYAKDKDNPDIWGMSAFDENGVTGHFTLRFPGENQDELRLGFVIVDDTRRGKGYGKELVGLALRFAFDFVGVRKVSLGVFENNASAIACYRSCGFQEVTREETEQYVCMGETWSCIEMEIKR